MWKMITIIMQLSIKEITFNLLIIMMQVIIIWRSWEVIHLVLMCLIVRENKLKINHVYSHLIIDIDQNQRNI